jgi:Zn-dependent M28 family amino/carboxypeptidase
MKKISILWVLLCIVACQPSADLDVAEQSITETSLLNHIEVLSSDDFEGRAPATRGEDLTVDYLIGQLEEMGIDPGMSDGTYTQAVPLLSQSVDRSNATFNIRKNGEVVDQLDYSMEFMAWPSNEAAEVRIQDAEVVYVGYGIQAPEFDWDDYKDVDVAGKILVFKNSDPSHDPEIFEGNARLYYGRWSYKFEKAEEMGALGAIIIHTPQTAGYPWLVVSNSWGRERFSLKSGDTMNGTRPEFNSWLTQRSSSRLLEHGGLSLPDALDAATSRDFSPILLEGVTIDVELNAEYDDMSTRNVIGKIEGSDPTLQDEYVIFSTHYDHLGVTFPVDGDSINNGALDNASGVSGILETAKALKSVEGDLRRSVLFMFVGAEEMGLLGSLYWSQNPTVHPGKVSANINLDSIQIFGETNDMVLIGYGRNSLTEIFESHIEDAGRVAVRDLQPEQGFFYRSDHFSYARIGIPAIYPNGGNDFIGKPEGWAATVDSVRATNYHSVSDEINDFWDMSGMESDVRLVLRASFDIINRDEMMTWTPGDEFEAIRLNYLQELE